MWKRLFGKDGEPGPTVVVDPAHPPSYEPMKESEEQQKARLEYNAKYEKEYWEREREAVLNKTVIIDGERKTVRDLDATKHRLIGTFRMPMGKMTYSPWMCMECGRSGYQYNSYKEHWESGCLDIMQYVTIDWGKESKPECTEG